jgi:hypothetical protein
MIGIIYLYSFFCSGSVPAAPGSYCNQTNQNRAVVTTICPTRRMSLGADNALFRPATGLCQFHQNLVIPPASLLWGDSLTTRVADE